MKALFLLVILILSPMVMAQYGFRPSINDYDSPDTPDYLDKDQFDGGDQGYRGRRPHNSWNTRRSRFNRFEHRRSRPWPRLGGPRRGPFY